jgi:hypothetical protein
MRGGTLFEAGVLFASRNDARIADDAGLRLVR